MLDVSPKNLVHELTVAKDRSHNRLAHFKEMVAEYHTGYYDGEENAVAENTAFEVVASVNPQLVFANPRAKLNTSRPEYQPKRVQALEFALNRWIRDTSPRLLYEEIAVDFQFAFGVTLTRPTPYPLRTRREGEDNDDPIHRPISERISPEDMLWDPEAKNFRSPRWFAHPVTKDRDDWVKQAQAENEEAERQGRNAPWNISVLKDMADEEGREEMRSLSADGDRPKRKSVTMWEMWIPEHELEESPGTERGFNGSWHLVSMGNTDKPPRDPMPAFCPRWGPYSFFSAYTVPDKQHPLSVLLANRGLHDTLNRQARANITSGERHKSIIILSSGLGGEGGDEEVADAIEETPDGGVVILETVDLQHKIQTEEIGGLQQVAQEQEVLLRERRDKGTGIAATKSGAARENVTATADILADQGADIRVSHLQQKFQVDGVAQHLRTVAWFLDADSRVVQYMGDPAATELSDPDPIWIGGLPDEREARAKREFPDSFQDGEPGEERTEGWDDEDYSLQDFDLLEVEIEPYSMQRTDDPMLQARAMQILNLAQMGGQMRVQMPWVRTVDLFNKVGNTFNMPNLGDTLFDDELATQVATMMLQGMEAQTQQSQPPARQAKDVGSKNVVAPPGGGNGSLGMPSPVGAFQAAQGKVGGVQ